MPSSAFLSLFLAAQTLAILPHGDHDPLFIEALGRSLSRRLALAHVTAKTRPLPVVAFDTARRQYSSAAILDLLAAQADPPGSLRLAVMEPDLFAPGMSFVLGQADAEARVAVISLFRLREENHTRRRNPRLLRERALKEAVHEIGHLLRLRHCSNPGCVMFFSNTLADTDRKSGWFCAECRRRLPRGVQRS